MANKITKDTVKAKDIDDIKIKEAKSIVMEIESLVLRKFEGYKNLSYNTNTKGYDYEFAVFKILEEYLNSRFNLYLRPHIMDIDMKYIEVLSKKGENEIDIVATFNSTFPSAILKTDKTTFVAYDSVAILIEVKSVLNSQSLLSDLKKFEKISKLRLDSNRFSNFTHTKFCVEDKPLRILVYDSASIKKETMETILNNNEFWDMIYVVGEKVTLTNKLNIPFAKFFQEVLKKNPTKSRIMYWEDVPFIILLLMVHFTVPNPQYVDIIKYFVNLVTIAFSKKGEYI